MPHSTTLRDALVGIGLSILIAPPALATITADQVVSYMPGTVQSSYWGAPYTNPSAVLGLPEPTQDVPNIYDSGNNQIAFADNSAITPFNGSYNPAHVLAISGAGAGLTVHLSAPIIVGSGAALGIHSGAGLTDASYPNGQNKTPAQNYTNSRNADLQVSADDVHWVDLGDQSFNNPTNIYLDATDPYGGTPGTKTADFSKPFFGSLHSFDGADFPATLAALDGSGGGTWFDLSKIDLPAVQYVRLSTSAGETAFVDAVVGTSAVPEPALGAILCAALLLRRQRRSQ